MEGADDGKRTLGLAVADEDDAELDDEPKEKKSTAGADEGTVRLAFCRWLVSSTDTFALPFVNDGGKKGKEDFLSVFSSMIPSVNPECSRSSSPPSSSTSSTVAVVRVDRFEPVLNTRPGPRPPPSTLSGAAGTGALFFGAGSMVRRADERAPRSKRAFFAGGSSDSIDLSSSGGSSGRPIVIFFGRLALGAGRDRLPEGLEDEADPEGGGSESDDFFDGAGRLAAKLPGLELVALG